MEIRFWLMHTGFRWKLQDVSPWRLRRNRSYENLFERSLDNFLDITGPFKKEFSTWRLPWLQNGFFEAGDAEFYYSMVRSRHPSLIIEVGAGWSSRFALAALRKNRSGRIVAIDPDPRSAIPPEVQHRVQRFEDTDAELFAALAPGDILFIDSSHTAEEARLHTELLRRLPAGVFIHHHDVIYPYQAMYDEEPVILEFYAGHTKQFRVLCGLVYATWKSRERCAAAVPSLRWNPLRSPRSLWVEKIG